MIKIKDIHKTQTISQFYNLDIIISGITFEVTLFTESGFVPNPWDCSICEKKGKRMALIYSNKYYGDTKDLHLNICKHCCVKYNLSPDHTEKDIYTSILLMKMKNIICKKL